MTAEQEGPARDPEIQFQTEPDRYRHWKLVVDEPVASLILDVDEQSPLFEGCTLKLNSYDLGVDIELADAVQRLRFEHPGVRIVRLRSAKSRLFCGGANIRMLARASHRHKVNFCKFTNETRLAMEDAELCSGQRYIAVLEGTAAGGGYELALAAGHIVLVDDGAAAVSLPEVPLLGVLPGTGGLTRLTDKRHVRRDLADAFCTIEEGVRGRRALEWGLVDEIVSRSGLEERLAGRVALMLAETPPVEKGAGVRLMPLTKHSDGDVMRYSAVELAIDRAAHVATITVRGPEQPPAALQDLLDEGAACWALRTARELDDAILHLRFNEPEVGVIAFKTAGDLEAAIAYDRLLTDSSSHWLVHEILLYWKRLLKRIDLTSRSLVALIEPGSCFAGVLAELAFAADRSYMLTGRAPGAQPRGHAEGDKGTFAAGGGEEARLALGVVSFSGLPMSNGLSRLATRFLGDSESLAFAESAIGQPLDAETALRIGLVTFAPDAIDWDDEVRLFLEERASFSPDALTALEANLRFAGPETMETKIFARLSAWQNWVFQRPNAIGPEGALKRYGSGLKPSFDPSRV